MMYQFDTKYASNCVATSSSTARWGISQSIDIIKYMMSTAYDHFLKYRIMDFTCIKKSLGFLPEARSHRCVTFAVGT